jgi:hypothetical protein
LFRVDEDPDPEYVQYLKKVLIELSSEAGTPGNLQRELLRRLQCIPDGREPDFRKQRLLMIKALSYLFSSFQLSARTIHLRIETRPGPDGCCNAVGVTLPLLSVFPGSPVRPEGSRKEDPVLGLRIQHLQTYCDYDCESYLPSGTIASHALNAFESRWRKEVHTSAVSLDVEAGLAAEVRRRTGLFVPRALLRVTRMQVAVDPRQLEVLAGLLEMHVRARRRCAHLVTLRATFGREGPTRLVVTGGAHILPSLAPAPLRTFLSGEGPRGSLQGSDSPLVALLRARVGQRWRRALWKHLIRVVLRDVRLARPLGRWTALIRSLSLCPLTPPTPFIFSSSCRYYSLRDLPSGC